MHGSHLLGPEKEKQTIVLVSKKATPRRLGNFHLLSGSTFSLATAVAELDRRNLNVHDAQIMTSKDGFVLDTFMVLDQSGEPIDEQYHQHLSIVCNRYWKIPVNEKHDYAEHHVTLCILT